MECEEYLRRSRLFRRLRSGPHGQLVERYAARSCRRRPRSPWHLAMSQRGRRSPELDRKRIAATLADLDERLVEQYLRHRARKQSIQPGDRAALKRWLSVLREAGAIAPAVLPPLTPHDRIFKEFDAYLRTERGLAPKSIVRHLPVIRRFLHEVCPGGDDDLGKISQEDVIRYIERHAQDWSPENREGDVLVAARLPPIPPSSGAEPARVGRLRAVDAAMEAREPADLSVRRAGAEGLDGCDRATRYGTAGLRHSDDAGQARPAGRRGRDAHPR